MNSGLISFRINWFDLLVVQGTLKSLLQHHSLKASAFQCSAFFMVQFSHPYMTTGKTMTLTIWTFVGTVIFLIFNMPSLCCLGFSSKEQECFNFMAVVTICSDFRAHEEEICHYFHLSPLYLLWSNGARCHDLSCFFFFNFNTGHLQTWRTHLSESCLFVLLYSL